MTDLPAHERRRLEAVAGDADHLARLMARRRAGEPLQYLEGTAAFGPFDLAVDPRVLIPRPETERLWEIARGLVTNPAVVVDLCTGSGAVAIALASSFPRARILGVDLSGAALDVARNNGARLASRVEWLQGDLFGPLDPALRGTVDLITANPPYVAETEWDSLPVDVRREPRMALVSGPTGLEVIEQIAESAGDWMAEDGVLVCEIGDTQGRAVAGLFARYRHVRVLADLTGRDRYVVAGR